MDDVIFIGGRRAAQAFRDAGIPSYAPPLGGVAERVLAEMRRCRVLAMTEDTFAALPAPLARDLREGRWPRVTIVPEMRSAEDRALVRHLLRQSLSHSCAACA